MSGQIDDGGAAFPLHAHSGQSGELPIPNTGMSLRDWFAGMALQGRAHRFTNPYNDRELLASDCYEIADAMIAARKGGAK